MCLRYKVIYAFRSKLLSAKFLRIYRIENH